MLESIKTLEFDIILQRISEFTVSIPARTEIEKLLPCADFIETALLLDIIDEVRLLYERRGFFVPSFDAVGESVARAKIGGGLSPAALANISAVLSAARLFKSAVFKEGRENVPNLYIWADAIESADDLENAINNAVDGDTVRDDASERLRTIRRRIIAQDNMLKQKLSAYSKSGEHSKFLQDNIVTVRGGRYVLPVKAEFRPNVPGIVHDKSAGGATVFVEPFAVVELNNELRVLHSEENAEVERILKELSEKVAREAEDITVSFEYAVMADVALAKYLYSKSINAVKPILNTDSLIEIKAGRHPLIDSNKIVPIDMALGFCHGDGGIAKNKNSENICNSADSIFGNTTVPVTKSIMLLSGPNTGGKTVTLKTIGLFCLMSACGIFVPCISAKLPVFSNIYCDIGDGQSIAESLSTFSSRLIRLKEITDNMDNRSLLLLDELGAGTDPNEGSALAIGIIERIKEAGSTALITTHFGELKRYSAGETRVIDASMQFDDETLCPTYKLIMGIPGVSNAIRIADNLGLDKRILAVANKYLKFGHLEFESALREAQKLKSDAMKELEKAEEYKRETAKIRSDAQYERENLIRQRESINKRAKVEVDKLVEKSKASADDIIAKLKECLKQGNENAYFEARKLAVKIDSLTRSDEKKTVEYTPIVLSQIKVGMTVVVISLGSEGIVKSIDLNKKTAQIVIGGMMVKVKANNLAEANFVGDQAKRPEAGSKRMHSKRILTSTETAPKSTETREINIIGQTVNEGAQLLDAFLTECIIAGVKKIRVVHGKGTGALGRGIQAHLKTLPYIVAYEYGGHYDGGTGATIVELK